MVDSCYTVSSGLHVIHIYDQVCDIYVRHVVNNFGTEVTVIFDGYREAMSTEVAEQQRRATQNISPDSIFELDMTVSTPHNRCLANRRNKAQFIGHVMTGLENVGVVCSKGPTDADHMISNTALTAAKLLDKSVVLAGNDTDLLVMLIYKAIPLIKIFEYKILLNLDFWGLFIMVLSGCQGNQISCLHFFSSKNLMLLH